MTKSVFLIIDYIDQSKINYFDQKLPNALKNKELLCYISSQGGNIQAMSRLVEKINGLKVNKIGFAGSIVESAAVPILASFDQRFSFKDSKFLIHESKPLNGLPRTEEFEKFDLMVWKFMASKMKKISFEDLQKIAKGGKSFSAEFALEIGLVEKIINKKANIENFLYEAKVKKQYWNNLFLDVSKSF